MCATWSVGARACGSGWELLVRFCSWPFWLCPRSCLRGIDLKEHSLPRTLTRLVQGSRGAMESATESGWRCTPATAPPLWFQRVGDIGSRCLHGVASHAKTTHGGLVTTLEQFDDIDVTAQLRTERQLRPQAPNPWEVAWLVWQYTDDHHFYSIVLKPNGWELGKEDPAYPAAQRFLATGTTPSFPIGVQHTVRVRQVGNEISVWANGTLLTTYADTERPYRRGSIGLYTEDAHVYFDTVVVRRP